MSRNVRRILSSGRNSVNCEYTIITIVIVFVITIAIPIVYEHERMQKGTSKDASFVNLNSPATPPWYHQSPSLHICPLMNLTEKSKLPLHLCFDDSLKSSAFLETTEYGIKIWHHGMGINFLDRYICCNISKMATKRTMLPW